jgi:hypothetical protein
MVYDSAVPKAPREPLRNVARDLAQEDLDRIDLKPSG